MATMPASARDALRTDISLVQAEARLGVVPSRATAADKTWDIWTRFCLQLDQDPLLSQISDKVQLVQVFARRLRDGRCSKSGQPLRAGTVADACTTVGQTFAMLGAPDPRKDHTGGIDFRLRRQLRHYGKQDPPSTRTTPVPIPVLIHAVKSVYDAAAWRGFLLGHLGLLWASSLLLLL